MPSSRDPIEFDPNLSIPFGLKDASYAELNRNEDLDLDPDENTQEQAIGDDLTDDAGGYEDATDDEALDTPSYMTIVSQTIRTAPDGRQVVDVVLDIEDIPGAVKYDVRVTK